MDTITQGLLGAVTAQLGFRQRIGRDATWVATAVAVLPDLDLLISPILSLTGTEHDDFDILVSHRGLSHSLFLAPAVALGAAVLWWWFKRPTKGRPDYSEKAKRAPFWLLYACVLVALFSAPLLDLCTSYGTQLFAPLSQRRYAMDAVPIVDIIYTPILILTLLGCYAVRKLKPRGRKAALTIAWIGFVLSVSYIGCGLAMRQIVLHRARAYFEQFEPGTGCSAEYAAYPQIPTIFVWRLTRRDEKSWTAMKVNVLSGADLTMSARNEAPIIDNRWVRRARQIEEVKVFEWFAMGEVWASYAHRNGTDIVKFHDMRYGRRPESIESLWSVRVSFDKSGAVQAVEHVRRYPGRDPAIHN